MTSTRPGFVALAALTAAALRPLLSGPNAPGTLNGAVAALVWP